MLRNFILVLTILFSGSVFAQPGSGKLEAVESGVTLKMEAPIMKDGSRKFYLDFRTNDVYECQNHFLDNEVRLEGNKLIVKIKGVKPMEPCITTMGPATARVDLTPLTAGKYKVRVIINRQVFKANLEVSETHYDLEIGNEDPQLFRIYNGRLNVIPANSIWGVCAYEDPHMKAEAEKFMDEMLNAGAQPTEIPAGNYGEFYLHYDGKTGEKVLSRDKYEYPFVFSYTGDVGALREVMNAFRDKLRITLKKHKRGAVSQLALTLAPLYIPGTFQECRVKAKSPIFVCVCWWHRPL